MHYVEGSETNRQDACGPDPTGIFISCQLEINPFENVPILGDFIPLLNLDVTANAFVTADVTALGSLIIPAELISAIKQMRDIIYDLIGELKITLTLVITRVSQFLEEVIELIQVDVDKIRVIISDLVDNLDSLSLASLLEAFARLADDIRFVLGGVKDAVDALVCSVEAHAIVLVEDVRYFIDSVSQLLSNTQWLTIQYVLSVQSTIDGFGIHVSGTLEVGKLVFGGLNIEFVYSDGSLGQCSNFNQKFSLLQDQKAFRIMGIVGINGSNFLFFSIDKARGIEVAYGLETHEVVGTFIATWSLLGIEVEAEAYISKEYIGASMQARVFNLFRAEIEVHATAHVPFDDMKLTVAATFMAGPDGFEGSLKDAIHIAANKLADEADARIRELQNGLDKAKQMIQGGINWLEEKQDRVNSANNVFDLAIEKLRNAQRKVAELQKPVDDALKKVKDAERNLDKVCRIRNCGTVCVPGLKCGTCKKGWISYPCCSPTSCMFRVPDAACHTQNAACMVVRGLAFAALKGAEVALYTIRIPFDLAQLTLKGAELIVDESRVVLDLAIGLLELAKINLNVLQVAVDVAKGALELARIALRGALKLAMLWLDVVLPVDIKHCGFIRELSVRDVYVIGIDCELNLFNTGWRNINFMINFGDIWQSLRGIASQVIENFASWLGNVFNRRKRDLGFDENFTPDTLESFSDQFTEDTGLNMTRIVLDPLEFADGLTTDEIRVIEYAEKCNQYESIAQFFSLAVESLLEVANDSKTTITDMKATLSILESMVYTNITNMTLENAEIDVGEASREYNLTRYEMEAAVDESTANITNSDMFQEVSKVSSWNQDIISDQMSDIQNYPLVTVWKEGMQNVTEELFNEEDCVGFLDCVIVSFIKLHFLYDGLEVPGCNDTREMIRDVEQQFVSIMLHSDTATIDEAYTFSHDILHLLERMNQTKVFCASPPVIVQHPSNVTLMVDQTLHLTCKATADPEPVYTWTKNGEWLPAHLGGQLVVEQTSQSDVGEYICIATNLLTSASSDPCIVTVEWAPEILSDLESMTVLEGFSERLSLACNISASPEAEIIWYSERLSKGELGSTEVQVLQNSSVIEYQIYNPMKKHSGKYWCRGENKYGAVSSNSMVLTVRQVTIPTITTRVSFGFLVVEALNNLKHNREELSLNMTTAVGQSVGLTASVTISWTDDDSGTIMVNIIMNNHTSDVAISPNTLGALYKNNMDRSLRAARVITAAAYAEQEIVVSACCTVLYDPGMLEVDGPHANCPEYFEPMAGNMCGKVHYDLLIDLCRLVI